MENDLIIIKFKSVIEQGKWEQFCKMFNFSLNIIDTNMFNEDDEWVLTKEQAKELGLK